MKAITKYNAHYEDCEAVEEEPEDDECVAEDDEGVAEDEGESCEDNGCVAEDDEGSEASSAGSETSSVGLSEMLASIDSQMVKAMKLASTASGMSELEVPACLEVNVEWTEKNVPVWV